MKSLIIWFQSRGLKQRKKSPKVAWKLPKLNSNKVTKNFDAYRDEILIGKGKNEWWGGEFNRSQWNDTP